MFCFGLLLFSSTTLAESLPSCFWLPSIATVSTMIKSTLGSRGTITAYNSQARLYHWGKSEKGLTARTWSQELTQSPQKNPAYQLLLMACSVWFLIQLRTTCLGVTLLIESWVPPISIINQEFLSAVFPSSQTTLARNRLTDNNIKLKQDTPSVSPFKSYPNRTDQRHVS